MHPKMLPLRAYHPVQLKMMSTNKKTAQLKLQNLTEPADYLIFSFLRAGNVVAASSILFS